METPHSIQFVPNISLQGPFNWWKTDDFWLWSILCFAIHPGEMNVKFTTRKPFTDKIPQKDSCKVKLSIRLNSIHKPRTKSLVLISFFLDGKIFASKSFLTKTKEDIEKVLDLEWSLSSWKPQVVFFVCLGKKPQVFSFWDHIFLLLAEIKLQEWTTSPNKSTFGRKALFGWVVTEHETQKGELWIDSRCFMERRTCLWL